MPDGFFAFETFKRKTYDVMMNVSYTEKKRQHAQYDPTNRVEYVRSNTISYSTRSIVFKLGKRESFSTRRDGIF